MKLTKSIRVTAFALTAMLISALPVYGAPSYTDVPSNHWAYGSISRVADLGYITGDTNGSFKPDEFIDKFTTSRILAAVAGYKNQAPSPTDIAYYNQVFEAYRPTISQFAGAYTKWSSHADKEIAYLLEKNVYSIDDLRQFVVKESDGTEKLRALSREEAAVYIARAIGKGVEAAAWTYSEKYKDDSHINNFYKASVYYMRDKGVVSKGDSNGNFNPRAGATRAQLAVMLDKSLNIISAQPPTASAPSSTGADPSNINKIESISGTIDKFYPALSGIQVVIPSGEKKIYRLATNASVYVDNFLKNANDLKEGMPFVAILQNGELLDVKAQSATSGLSQPSAAGSASSAQLFTVEGVIKAVTQSNKSFGLEIRMINPKGNIITETHTYLLSADAKVTRGESATTFESVQVGDVARVQFSGNTAVTLELEEKNRVIKDGVLLEKKFIDLTNTAILVIKDKSDKKYELRVAADTSISRRGTGIVSWKDLRIGDVVQEAYAEYDKLQSIITYGVLSSVDGVIEEIHILKNRAYIHLRESDNLVKSYEIIPGAVDPYILRLNSTVRLRLDSQEIESVSVIRR